MTPAPPPLEGGALYSRDGRVSPRGSCWRAASDGTSSRGRDVAGRCGVGLDGGFCGVQISPLISSALRSQDSKSPTVALASSMRAGSRSLLALDPSIEGLLRILAASVKVAIIAAGFL